MTPAARKETLIATLVRRHERTEKTIAAAVQAGSIARPVHRMIIPRAGFETRQR